MSSFKKHTPAELRALAQRIDDANEGIEASRDGLQVKKVKVARNMKDNRDAMALAFPDSKVLEMFESKAGPSKPAEAGSSNALVVAYPQQKPEVNEPPEEEEEEEAPQLALPDGDNHMIPKGEAKEVTAQAKEGENIEEYIKKNAEAKFSSKTLKELLYINNIEQTKDAANQYYLTITGAPYGDGLTFEINKTPGAQVKNILEGTTSAMVRDNAVIVFTLNEIVRHAKAYAPEDFPMKVTLGSEGNKQMRRVSMLLRHPKDVYGAKTNPPNTGSSGIEWVEWRPNEGPPPPVQLDGKGLSTPKSFTVSPNGAFGDAHIDPIELKLNNQLIAHVGKEEMINEKVSDGLVNLFLSKTFNVKKTKQADIVRFMELMDIFNFVITPHIKKTAKYAKLVDSINDASGDADADIATREDINRNIAAMQAGNKSGALVRETFDMLDALVKSGELSQERKDEYVRNIVLLVGL